jgi:hypothetical protein
VEDGSVYRRECAWVHWQFLEFRPAAVPDHLFFVVHAFGRLRAGFLGDCVIIRAKTCGWHEDKRHILTIHRLGSDWNSFTPSDAKDTPSLLNRSNPFSAALASTEARISVVPGGRHICTGGKRDVWARCQYGPVECSGGDGGARGCKAMTWKGSEGKRQQRRANDNR